jgi:hypothetical protein
MHAQFIVIPPLTKITELFTKVTDKEFAVGIAWAAWNTVAAEEYERFRKYIRPSHQKMLSETISGEADSPCSFLRQILRPHGYTIRRNSHGWNLQKVKEDGGDEETSPRVSMTTLQVPTTITWA